MLKCALDLLEVCVRTIGFLSISSRSHRTFEQFRARRQQIEAGRPITVKTLLRISEAFDVPLVRLVRGLDR